MGAAGSGLESYFTHWGQATHDQLVTWLKPKTCPLWLAKETLAALPEALVLREMRYQFGTPGFRTRQITLVTTLLDPESYPVTETITQLSSQTASEQTLLVNSKTPGRAVLHTMFDGQRE